MTALILCPGESLASYVPQPADLVLTVNRAGLAHESDVWCALDYLMIRDNALDVMGNPRLLSRRQTICDTAGWLGRFPAVMAFEDFPTPNGFRDMKTMFAAALYAAAQGATSIKVYGCDWMGTKDFDGTEAGEDRTETRWAKEQVAWDSVIVPWLEQRGVSVERMSQNVTFHHPV